MSETAPQDKIIEEPVQGDQVYSPEDEWILAQDFPDQLVAILDLLPPAESMVFANWIGLSEVGIESRAELGRRLGVDEQQIRGIEASALRVLKSSDTVKKIQQIMDFYPNPPYMDPKEAYLNGVMNALTQGDKKRARENALIVLRKMIYTGDDDDQKVIATAKLMGRAYFTGRKLQPDPFYYNLRICLSALDN